MRPKSSDYIRCSPTAVVVKCLAWGKRIREDVSRSIVTVNLRHR